MLAENPTNRYNNTGREVNQAPPNGQGTGFQIATLPRPLLILDFRRLNQSPRRLPHHRRLALFSTHKKYRKQLPYLVFIANPETGNIADARIVKTDNTLYTLNVMARRWGLALLVHPQPIAIPEGFWQEWKREARTPAKRLELIRKYELAKDKNIFALTRIIVDVDQPYETAEQTVLSVFKKLGIVRGFVLGRTKSGNLRGIVYLTHTAVRIGYEVRQGVVLEDYRHFYLSPHTKHSNGHTHYQNFREFLAILYGLLEKEGLKVDWSFFDRVNHPIWWSRLDTRFFTPVLSRSGSTRFYTLYNRAKKVQEQEGLWEVPKRGKPFNLTQHFWPQHYKPREEKEEKRVEIPAFVRNHFDAFVLWQRAVESLAKKHSRERFMRVIVPAVG
ncbi:MAG: hypothetical protein RMK75_07875, partial [Aquificaceae bacterium]|nr:hypothetical protein [Aquificaceae bacterium]MDW8424218.1 hypothetical protein [Aquificaceae bacterium]